MPIEILENTIIDDSQNLNLTGSGTFAGDLKIGTYNAVTNLFNNNDETIQGVFIENEGAFVAARTNDSVLIVNQKGNTPAANLARFQGNGSDVITFNNDGSAMFAGIVNVNSLTINGVAADTSTQVDTKISNAIDAIPGVDLSNYDTSAQVDTKISNAIDAIPGVDLSNYDTSAQVDVKIANLVDSAPETLNTLGELATALSGNDSAIDSILSTLSIKANLSSLATVATSGSYTDLINKPDIVSPTGSGASGTWSINITGSAGDAATLGGASASVSASNGTIVQRNSSGHIFANYFNTTPNDVASGVTKVCVETGNDGYIRHGNAAAIRSFLNVADGANLITDNNQIGNGRQYITSASVGNGTITITQPGTSNQTFTVNQSGNTTITLKNDNTTYSVGDNGLTQKNFTTTLKNKLDGIASGATNTSQPFYTSAIAVGDGGLTEKNFTTTLKNKLDGISSNQATNTTSNVTFATVTASGDITAFSDISLKESINTINDALSKVKKIRGVSYIRKDTKQKCIGVIAQEIEKVLPEVVKTTEYKSVAYGNIVGLLIESIKEQQKQIDEQQKQIIDLQAAVG